MQATLHWLTKDPAEWIRPAAVFVATVLVAGLARQLLLRALRAWATRSASKLGQILADALRAPTLIWIVILGVHLAIEFSHLPKSVTKAVPTVMEALWIILLTTVGMRIARDLVRHYGGQIPGALPVTSLTQNLAQLAVLTLGLLPLLRLFGVELAPMLTALGVGGLAVALALQDTLSNLFAGFHVALAGQVRLGDYIKLNTGEEGYVADIGWRSASIRSLTNNLIIVPNAKLAQAIVTNYHLPEKCMASSLQVGVSYDSDPDRIERVLLEVVTQGAREIPAMLAEPAPSVAFDPGFGESALSFTLNYQVAEFADQFNVRNELRRRVLRRLKEEGIVMPFTTRTVKLEGPK
jgi:small-conductance mechanosensitive channel